MTVTLKFQSSGMVPGNGQPVTMRGGSLTVGRGPANDLVLPDPDRMLSKNHFVLEEHNGRYVIVDLSTNGTFLNYSKVPLGRTPKPLNSGDVLSAGGYELVVEIGAELPDLMDIPAPTASAFPGNADTSSDPLAVLDDPSIEGDFLDDLLGAEGGPKGPTQIDTSDPIDELLLPMGDEEDPFFKHPEDGTEGSGASLEMHSPSTNDSFKPGAAFDTSLIPDDWDNLLEPDNPAPTKTPETVVPKPEVAQAPVRQRLHPLHSLRPHQLPPHLNPVAVIKRRPNALSRHWIVRIWRSPMRIWIKPWPVWAV